VPHEIVAPPDREYTGIKRIDRRSGFEGLTEEALVAAIDRLVDRIERRSA
jgi:hypothetical protein